MPSPNAELLPGTLQLLILRTLVSGAVHGYAIAKKIKETSSGLLQVEEGSLYPALNRMLVKGWVTAEWGLSETNRKARYYTLTREGRKQLAREARGLEELELARVVFDAGESFDQRADAGAINRRDLREIDEQLLLAIREQLIDRFAQLLLAPANGQIALQIKDRHVAVGSKMNVHPSSPGD